jgi:hypothetical protein
MTETQRFPAPWRIVEMSDRFAVLDATGHSVAFFHFTNRPDAAESAIELFKKQALRRAAEYAGPMLGKRDGDG